MQTIVVWWTSHIAPLEPITILNARPAILSLRISTDVLFTFLFASINSRQEHCSFSPISFLVCQHFLEKHMNTFQGTFGTQPWTDAVFLINFFDWGVNVRVNGYLNMKLSDGILSVLVLSSLYTGSEFARPTIGATALNFIR